MKVSRRPYLKQPAAGTVVLNTRDDASIRGVLVVAHSDVYVRRHAAYLNPDRPPAASLHRQPVGGVVHRLGPRGCGRGDREGARAARRGAGEARGVRRVERAAGAPRLTLCGPAGVTLPWLPLTSGVMVKAAAGTGAMGAKLTVSAWLAATPGKV